MNHIQSAKDFLASCNATITIQYTGLSIPTDDVKPRRSYNCTITTPQGIMNVRFYDSIENTKLHTMSLDAYCMATRNMHARDLSPYEITKMSKLLTAERAKAIPSEYDILASLQLDDMRRCFTPKQIAAIQMMKGNNYDYHC